MASRKTNRYTKFPVKRRKELGDNLACVDCEDVASEELSTFCLLCKSQHQLSNCEMMSNILNRTKQLFLRFSKACSHFPDSHIVCCINSSLQLLKLQN